MVYFIVDVIEYYFLKVDFVVGVVFIFGVVVLKFFICE